MKQETKFPKPSKKLFHVVISMIEQDTDSDTFHENSSRKEAVVATSADEAIRRVKLHKSKEYEEFFIGVSMISGIDIL